ncbi:hypothetical protein BMS3Abin07_02072 [bacterium BMS3Abin07]|nr:hypothetical protein BMS3Abin07_02072 [bacterium BMS3Abin07]GBE32587.1 hypothetical protein BMS3Bbin05_01503 [bacterium BMS3Bbin05]HDO21790.1 hypothetical protein [Nitrospirota bacterium]HDZ87256.1 hypothetical protein [Nitrospirota bacterium]
MKKFKPSDDFVSKVMRDVYSCEKTKEMNIPLSQRLISSRLVRYAMSAGGLVLGIWNLTRLYLTVFAPVICR